MSDEEFHALDGKYILMQLVECYASWTSRIVPEVKDHWALFRLFDGVYDSVPEDIDTSTLKDAMLFCGPKVTSCFNCESSMFYFKKRNCKVICNRKDMLEGYKCGKFGMISLRNRTDSHLAAAMGMGIECGEFTGTPEEIEHICQRANRAWRSEHWYKINELEMEFAAGHDIIADIIDTAAAKGGTAYEAGYIVLTDSQRDALFTAEENLIKDKIRTALLNGGKLYSIFFGKTVGFVTVDRERIDNLCVEGRYQRNGLGTRLLEFAFSVAGDEAYIDVPASHKSLLHICERIGLVRTEENDHTIRMKRA